MIFNSNDQEVLEIKYILNEAIIEFILGETESSYKKLIRCKE